jgi:hypothetical protein
MRKLVDIRFPDAELIRVVLDNLSSHSGGALYEAFDASEARRIFRKLEFHYMPKHGSWLNMAEIEISVLGRQCLDRRIDSVQVCNPRSSVGKPNATMEARRPTGDSPSRMPESSFTGSTHHDHISEQPVETSAARGGAPSLPR